MATDGVANTEIAERLEVSRSTVHGRRQGFAGHGVDWVGKVRPGRGPKPTASQDRIEKMVHDTLHSARRRLLVPLEGPAVGGGRSHDNTAERAGRATRARTARRRRATPPERTSTPCASSANVPPRPRRRPVRSHRWHTARLRGGVALEWVERRTSTKLDPGVTSSETARIRDRERTGSSAERTRSRCHASAFFAAAESARNVPRLLQSTGGSAEPICGTLW